VTVEIRTPPLTHHVPSALTALSHLTTKLPSGLISDALVASESGIQVPVTFCRISESLGLMLQAVSNRHNAIIEDANLMRIFGTAEQMSSAIESAD